MKKAIIVGASSGIGKEFAKVLVTNGYKVGITGRREDLLREIKYENPERYLIKSFDISIPFKNSVYLDELVSELGGLDLLVISSGTGNPNEYLDFAIEKLTLDTNVYGITEIADWGFNYFRNQGHGHLAVITSVAGMRGGRFATVYAASKAYQINYFEGLRQKAKKLKIPFYVTDIRPGFVDTAMAKSDYKFWVCSPQVAAKQIYKKLLKKKKIAYITNRWILIAYIMKLLPKWIYDRI
jgi:short-subunit dehydrogenase